MPLLVQVILFLLCHNLKGGSSYLWDPHQHRAVEDSLDSVFFRSRLIVESFYDGFVFLYYGWYHFCMEWASEEEVCCRLLGTITEMALICLQFSCTVAAWDTIPLYKHGSFGCCHSHIKDVFCQQLHVGCIWPGEQLSKYRYLSMDLVAASLLSLSYQWVLKAF